MTDWSLVLEDDLRWREAELSSLKRVAITSSDNRVLYEATLRASWAMLYAHFEGFTKFCWELILDQIQSRRIPVDALNDDFRVLALEKSFRELRANLSSQSLWEFFKSRLPSLMTSDVSFADECRLSTESNLWPNIFERECAKLGIKSREIEAQRSRIKALVSRRNDIAHGRTMTIKSVGEYSEYEQATLLVLHELAIVVLGMLEDETYMANPISRGEPEDGKM